MDHDTFIERFSTRTGRWLANRLNLKGPGSETLANLISCYAWNKRAGEYNANSASNNYLNYCKTLREDIEAHPLWPKVQPIISFW